MSRLAVWLCLAVALPLAAQSEKPRLTRPALALQAAAPLERPRLTRPAVMALEQAFNAKIKRAGGGDPMELLTYAQGVYIEGFGVVLVSEVDLIMTPAPSPFRPPMTKPDIDRIRARKLANLPLLRQLMQRTMAETAAAAETLPPGEQIVLAVTIPRMKWEDTAGLPAQIVMQASRQKLLNAATAATAIQVQEF